MGAKNVGLVLAHWGHLNDRPFRVLVFMALQSLDKDTPPRYYGGWRSIALSGLGRNIDDATEHEVEATKKAVHRAVAELRKAGAITLLNSPKIGERGNYALNLKGKSGGQQTSTTTDEEGDADRPPQVDAECPPRGGHSAVEEGDADRPPKEEHPRAGQEPLHEKDSPSVTNIQSARDRARRAARASATR